MSIKRRYEIREHTSTSSQGARQRMIPTYDGYTRRLSRQSTAKQEPSSLNKRSKLLKLKLLNEPANRS